MKFFFRFIVLACLLSGCGDKINPLPEEVRRSVLVEAIFEELDNSPYLKAYHLALGRNLDGEWIAPDESFIKELRERGVEVKVVKPNSHSVFVFEVVEWDGAHNVDIKISYYERGVSRGYKVESFTHAPDGWTKGLLKEISM